MPGVGETGGVAIEELGSEGGGIEGINARGTKNCHPRQHLSVYRVVDADIVYRNTVPCARLNPTEGYVGIAIGGSGEADSIAHIVPRMWSNCINWGKEVYTVVPIAYDKCALGGRLETVIKAHGQLLQRTCKTWQYCLHIGAVASGATCNHKKSIVGEIRHVGVAIDHMWCIDGSSACRESVPTLGNVASGVPCRGGDALEVLGVGQCHPVAIDDIECGYCGVGTISVADHKGKGVVTTNGIDQL